MEIEDLAIDLGKEDHVESAQEIVERVWWCSRKEVQVQVEVEVSAQKAKNQALEFQATCDMLTVEKEEARRIIQKFTTCSSYRGSYF